MYIICVILCLFSALSRRVGAFINFRYYYSYGYHYYYYYIVRS